MSDIGGISMGKVRIIYEKRIGMSWLKKEYITKNKMDYNRVMLVFKNLSDDYRLVKEECIEKKSKCNTSMSLIGCLPVYLYNSK